LARAFLARERHLAALAAVIEARDAGADRADLDAVEEELHQVFGSTLESWNHLVGRSARAS
jgi:hypothetical protein